MSLRLAGTLRPSGPVTRSERPTTFPRGRVCAEPECTTVLSVYNPERHCALHTIRDAPRSRRRPLALVLFERACEDCGLVFETGNVRKRFCSDRCRVHAFQCRTSRAQREEARESA